jgi:hypothetical protein
MKLYVCILAVLFAHDSASAQRWFVTQGRPAERVIGLLDLHDVTAKYRDKDCEHLSKQESVSAQLYRDPSKTAATIGAVYLRPHPEYGCTLLFRRAGSAREEELPSQESEYEIAAAVVHERRGRWFRIAVPQGSAWIDRTNAADFLPYPQLLTKKLAYLTDDWDGRLRKTAGFGGTIQALPLEWKEQIPKQIGVEVLSVTRVGNNDWLHVRFDIDSCGDDSLRGLTSVEGWLPAYRSDGTPAAWFYSRGC